MAAAAVVASHLLSANAQQAVPSFPFLSARPGAKPDLIVLS